MGKTLLVFLTVFFAASMLSGCLWYPYHGDGRGRGYRDGGGHYEGRDYDRQREGDRDYRDRR